MITSFLIAAAALVGTFGLIVSWIVQQFKISKQIAADEAVRAERLKPIDAIDTTVKTEVKSNETKLETYERLNGVKLVHPTDDGSGTK